MSNVLHFPDGFSWGAATASYQIEGATDADGRGPSIWDEFTARPGAVIDGTTGATACDHYHRYAEDVGLMKELGLQAYRFSIAWPRVVPDGTGPVNQAGLDFYSRLVDQLLAAGIEPFATLYHWDLPAALQHAGGWANRDTVDAYLRYAEAVTAALGDRVRFWSTHNEPWVVSFVGHLFGEHAPGIRDLRTALTTAHHILLSHGKAVPVIRANARSDAQVGIVHNLEWVEPAVNAAPGGPEHREEDVAASWRHDGAFNRWFLDPVFRGEYPQDMLEWYGADAPRIHDGDLDAIAARIDYLGINYYTRRIIADDQGPDGGFLKTRKVIYPFVPRAQYEQWEVAPEGLYRLLMRVARDYGSPALYITENGTPLQDKLEQGGQGEPVVRDPARIDYLRRHFGAVWQAVQDGVDVRGYFVWSLMDNYEWNLGHTKRFGLVYTDYQTQRRIVKDSGHWYSAVCRENAVEG